MMDKLCIKELGCLLWDEELGLFTCHQVEVEVEKHRPRCRGVDESCGRVFSRDNDMNELVEVDLSQFGFVETP